MPATSFVLGAPASIIGSELSRNGAPAFIVLCPVPIAYAATTSEGATKANVTSVVTFQPIGQSTSKEKPMTEYPSGCPGPFVASIPRRRGRPEEVRHVPDNSGVSGRGVDNLALDALPTVPSSCATGCRCTIALAGALVRVSGAGCLQT